MPYASIEDLPQNIQNNLPIHAQEIFKETFNNALEKYSNEVTAFKVAWAAVKKKYQKDQNGLWREKN